MAQKFEFLDRAIEAARHCDTNGLEFPADVFRIDDHERLYAHTLIVYLLNGIEKLQDTDYADNDFARGMRFGENMVLREIRSLAGLPING